MKNNYSISEREKRKKEKQKQNQTQNHVTSHHTPHMHLPVFPPSVVFLMIPGEMLISFGGEYFMFLTCQLSMAGYWPTMAVMGPIESVFESGEGA